MKAQLLLLKDSEVRGLFKYYSIYSIIYILINISLISIIAFFHFLLDHDMSVVENWIYRNNWEIMVLCKMAAAFSIIKILELRIYEERFLYKFLKKSIQLPKHHIFVIIFFLMSFILALGQVSYASDHSKYTSYHLISFVSSFVYFGIDYILLFFLRSFFQIQKKWENYTFMFLSSILFVSTSLLSIPHPNLSLIYLLLHFLTILIFTLSSSPNLIVGLSYCLFFISPLTSLIGLDPVWGNDFSMFELKNPLPFLYVFCLWSVSFAYLYFVRGKRLVD